MTIIYHRLIEQNTDAWFDLRRGLITASSMKQILTPTNKPAKNDESRAYLNELLAERITGRTWPSFSSADTMRGHELEPLARDLYAEKYKYTVEQCGFITCIWQPGVSVGYSPDGLIGDKGLLEIKCPRPKNHIRTILRDEVPPQYIIQCQAGLAVSGRDWLDYVSYCPGLPLYVKLVKPDPELIDRIYDAVIDAERQLSIMRDHYNDVTANMPQTDYIETQGDIEI